jgi:hypothetical protein
VNPADRTAAIFSEKYPLTTMPSSEADMC